MMMHVISADTTVADSIRYTQYRFRSDTDPIVVRSLVCYFLNLVSQWLHIGQTVSLGIVGSGLVTLLFLSTWHYRHVQSFFCASALEALCCIN